MGIIGRIFQTPPRSKELEWAHAYTGRILRVNLSTGHMGIEEPEDSFYRAYIGGRGVILAYLLNELAPRTDPLGPDNILIFAPGILTGTSLMGTGRHAVGGKSPLTGALASGEAGGWWGAELKRAGFDAIVIIGKAETAVYIWVKDGRVEIRDAEHVWGLKTGPTQDAIRNELADDKIRIAQIGPAGEKLVRFAAVMHDVNRAAGRSGLGAVMGSKNLKAVAVRGTQPVGVADKALMALATRWISSNYKKLMGWAISYGTSGSVLPNHDGGATAIRNYRQGIFEGIENLDATGFFPQLLSDRDTCNRCPVRCKLVVDYKDADCDIHISGQYGGPEYESIGGLGPLCAVNDAVAVAKANELCAAYGLDTISTGGTIAFTMECAEKGLFAGFDFLPQFGDGQALIESVERIANRNGIGDLMAEGSQRMADKLGLEAQEMLAVARGQELPLHDPRLKHTMGMGYALSATGADHMHNLNDTFATFPGSDVCNRLKEMGIETPLELWGISDHKIKAFYYETAFRNFMDSAVICHFYPYEYHHMVDALNAAGGWDINADEVNQIGERIITMGRLFLLREGFTAKDDTLSTRAFYPLSEGPIKGKFMTPEELADGLQRYYTFMGWNEQGVPSEEKLIALGISKFS
jgi:aldehyde:ferredoxin oxidoreductase